MDEATLLTLATGPTSSLILMLGGTLAVWRFVTNHIVPAGKAAVEAHIAQVQRSLEQVDTLIVEHGKDREAWLTSMKDCRDQGDRIERRIGGLYGRLDQLSERIK